MESNLNRFGGMSIIVTGAASGIGKATVERFLSEGANATALGHHRDKLEAAFEGADKDRLQLMDGNVADPDLAPKMIAAAVDRFRGVDVLVNNAGMGTGGTIEDISLEDWNRQMAVNVTGYFLMAKAAMPEIRKTKGAIVMTSSVSGLGGDWSFVGYNASKGAITNMVRAMALDHAGEGIRVNAVCPSMTKTGMTEGMQDNDELLDKFFERIPSGRAGEPEEIAAVIAFLASKDAVWVNGVNLPVDGGLSASNGQPPLG